MAFSVCTENPIENLKSYELKLPYFIAVTNAKHFPMSSGRESRFKFELG